MMTKTDKERAGKRVIRNGQVWIHSDVLALSFRADVDDPRSKRLETMVSSLEYLALNPKRAR